MNWKHWSKLILSTALAGGLMLAIGAPARADHDYNDECHRRLEADRARIDHDAARYGEHSHQVGRDVTRMDATRQWCKDHKADWDHSRFDVGVYFHL